MLVEWTEDLAVGVEEIDNQHKELYKRLNSLLEACSQGKGRETISQTLAFLGEYTVSHFSAEEKLMAKHNYPEIEQHKEQHKWFVEAFMDLKKQLEEYGPAGHIVIKTNRVLVGWLNSHIRNIDKKLGLFLQDK
ncbi:MAG TPA: hemerythrin family protein [Firmicutes bacterium]|jgi:hemerythrin|nr:hemerythrin family protein [Bacillota bacterium]HOQ23482.1 bacteriohemerythrin [Bacillota bacterium]HPT68404.1 bacteriohemerythrin [Bacillota bacterium]